ncbi:hypothetical protein IQ270_08490 [Microcoleus sp. LEGE 07076]|nr:hypothetical protein [Microcoleus sp. LEGE 07076]
MLQANSKIKNLLSHHYRSQMFGNAIGLFAENRIPHFREPEYIKYRLSQMLLSL